MTRSIFVAATLALAAVLPAVPAQAASLTRTFVSSAGHDSNPCTITQPCATFAVAYAATAANGIIAALDPGKYGPLTITGPVTVNGYGWAAITGPAAGNAITINAVSGNVTLTGLEIDGAGAAYHGIVFNSGSSLTVTNCVVQNFVLNGGQAGNGILMQPTSGLLDFTITNTTVANNEGNGVVYQPPSGSPSANGVIDHVVANANNFGISVDTILASGGMIVVTISNTIASNNVGGGGIFVQGTTAAPAQVSIDNVGASGNNIGIKANNPANVLLNRSVITGNTTGLYNDTVPNTFYTYGNNLIDLNTTNITNALNTTVMLR
jgi:hypothetical protein